ncbi:polysaccharide biosynthesis/export family protein [Mariniflexile sp.]|uniref:polysaccharide biosynthesis/export family protein n=1 Tax=Mariniflexile sp. TaxID=1979402 RepID=UPI00404815C4
MNKSILTRKLVIVLCAVSLFLTSCTTKKDVVYFQNAKDFETIVNTDTFTSRFKINDIVSINVSAYDLTAAKPFNLIVESGQNSTPIDYLIDTEGNIDFPVLGKIKLLGLTVEEAKQLFKEKLSNGYLKDPVINIRILNFRISVLGAVTSPGVYPISGERINILEAIANAGDLDLKGRRDNILVIRDFNGAKTYTRIDITNKEVFNSPVYFLTQNDVVYVQPNTSAISGSGGDLRIGQFLGYASFVMTAILLATRF